MSTPPNNNPFNLGDLFAPTGKSAGEAIGQQIFNGILNGGKNEARRVADSTKAEAKRVADSGITEARKVAESGINMAKGFNFENIFKTVETMMESTVEAHQPRTAPKPAAKETPKPATPSTNQFAKNNPVRSEAGPSKTYTVPVNRDRPVTVTTEKTRASDAMTTRMEETPVTVMTNHQEDAVIKNMPEIPDAFETAEALRMAEVHKNIDALYDIGAKLDRVEQEKMVTSIMNLVRISGGNEFTGEHVQWLGRLYGNKEI